MPMPLRTVWVVTVFFFAIGVAALSGYRAGKDAQIVTQPLKEPIVLSAADVGFRMVGRRGDQAVGELVVRLDGQWVRAVPGAAPKPAAK